VQYAPPAGVRERGRVIASHGWMDNAASFHLLAPELARAGWRVLALDLPGHGRSDHRPPSAHYSLAEYAAAIIGAADELGWDRFLLLGHSMGAGCSTLVAAGFPERVAALVLVDNIGPSTRPVSETAALFARSVTQHVALAARGAAERPRSSYASLDAAVQQRLATVARYEGAQSLSREGAAALVSRALAPARGGGGGFQFVHDPRIAAPSLTYLHEEQVRAVLRAVACPTLVVRGDRGWPMAADVVAGRLAAFEPGRCTVRTLPGSHHLHLDPETAPAVDEAVRSWLNQTLPEAVT
jgi:pimeloyl-ACP methyl ester carboxylesterase